MSRTDTTDPDGLHFFRVKFNDAGEMYGRVPIYPTRGRRTRPDDL